MKRSLLVVLLALWLAPAAFAQSALIRTGARSTTTYAVSSTSFTLAAGPRLAGDEVLWAELRGGTFAAVAQGPAGRRTLGEYPAQPSQVFALDAAEGRVALGSYFMTCFGDESCSKYQQERPAGEALRGGPVGGPLADERVPPCAPIGVVAAAGATAVSCWYDDAEVRSGDGTSRRVANRSGPRSVQVAGGYVARSLVTREMSRETVTAVVVEDRISGREALRVDGPARGFDLAPDGTLAVALPDGRIVVASPGRREQSITAPFDVEDVRVANDRIAARSGGRFAVLDRDGSVVAQHGATSESDWDFDGRRVAWLARPCSLVTVSVWDVGAAPPPSAGDRCAPVVVDATRVTVSRARRFGLPLRCPLEAPAGCAGQVSFTVRGLASGGRATQFWLEPIRYDLDPGTVLRGTVDVSARDLRRLRRLRRPALEVRAASGAPVTRVAVRLPPR